MSIIPQSNLAQQQIDPRTGRQQTRVPSAVEGQGLVAAGQGLQNLGVAVSRVERRNLLDEERDRQERQGKIDRSTAYDTYSTFTDRTRQLESGYLDLKLGAAIGSFDKSQEQIDALQQEAEESLANLDQKLMFGQLSTTHRRTFLNSIETHERVQTDAWDKQSGQLQVDDGKRTAIDHYLDPDAAATAKASVQIGIERILPGDENAKLRKEMFKNELSEIHEGIIGRLLVNDPIGAKSYYDKNKKAVLAENKADIEKKLTSGLLEQRAQVRTDLIVNSGKSFEDQLLEVNKISDAEERKLVSQGVKTRKSEADFVDKQRYEGVEDQIGRSIIAAPSLEAAQRLSRNPNLKAKDQLKWSKVANSQFERKKRGDIDSVLGVYADARALINKGEIKSITQLEPFLADLSNSDGDGLKKFFEKGGVLGTLTDARGREIFKTVTQGKEDPRDEGAGALLYQRAWNYVEQELKNTDKPTATDSEIKKLMSQAVADGEQITGGFIDPDMTYAEAVLRGLGKVWLPEIADKIERTQIDNGLRLANETLPGEDKIALTEKNRRIYKKHIILEIDERK